MYHKKICRLQPTTSYHTVLGFPILARVPAQNFSNFEFIHVTFGACSSRMDSKMITCVTHSKTETLKVTGSPCHYIFYLVEDGPLCRHRIRAKRVIFDNLVHSNCIIIMCNFFSYHSHQWWFLIVGLLATSVYGKFRRGCLCKSSMRSGDIVRICRGRLSIGNLQGHTPCVLHCVPSHLSTIARKDFLFAVTLF